MTEQPKRLSAEELAQLVLPGGLALPAPMAIEPPAPMPLAMRPAPPEEPQRMNPMAVAEQAVAPYKGLPGTDGIDGRGIEDMALSEQGELIITFTDGTQKNLGKLSVEASPPIIVNSGSAGSGVSVKDEGVKIGHNLTTLNFTGGGVTVTKSRSQANISVSAAAVTSVFGRTGAVVAASGDYTTAQVTESGNLYYTDERAQDAVGGILTDTATIDFTYNDAGNTITADVINDSITYAKIQNVTATNKLLARYSSGAGDPEEAGLGTGLAFNSGTLTYAECFVVAVSDETTALTTGTAKVTFRMPYAFTLTSIPRASLSTASSSGDPTFDINESGTTILGANKLSIDANEKTSTTAATATTLADTAIADDAEITIDIDTAGTGAKGAKIYLYGRRT